MNAIEIENVSKQYRLGLVSTGTISHDINRWWAINVMHKEDPYLKIGETNDRSKKGESDYVWALKDINFNVEQGDVVGIIGKNGAGKSTLLKLLSRVTTPTTGEIRVRGRMASLLEVGTGFHPEMTGRENVYLNGAIMGMTKAEITSKLDEIVDFSGCERYIDTPVKRYSSGMKVRLGFAVAAHLEPEILIVDEVLAVGDAEFQKKAVGKMKDISHGGGRTVLFVSHNMTAVKSLCKKGVLLENGMVKETGIIDDIVSHYLRGDNDISNYQRWDSPTIVGDGFELLSIGIKKKDADYNDTMTVDDDLELIVHYKILKPFDKFHLTFHLKNEQGAKVFSFSGGGRCISLKHEIGIYEQKCIIPSKFLNWGNYSIDILPIIDQHHPFARGLDVLSFSLVGRNKAIGTAMGKEPGDVTPTFDFFERNI